VSFDQEYDQDGIDAISPYLLPSFRDAKFEKTLNEAAEHAINLVGKE